MKYNTFTKNKANWFICFSGVFVESRITCNVECNISSLIMFIIVLQNYV